MEEGEAGEAAAEWTEEMETEGVEEKEARGWETPVACILCSRRDARGAFVIRRLLKGREIREEKRRRERKRIEEEDKGEIGEEKIRRQQSP